MLTKTEGIVIHTLRYSDSAVIAKIFTHEFGLLPFMIRGARNKKSTIKPVMLQPLFMLAMDISVQQNKNFHIIKELRPIHHFTEVHNDTLKMSLVLFIAELLHKVLKEHDVNPALFELLRSRLLMLNEPGFDPDFHLKCMLDLSEELGFLPFNNYSQAHPVFSIRDGRFVHASSEHTGDFYLPVKDSHHLHILMNNDPHTFLNDDRRQLLNALLKFYQFHIPGMGNMKSHHILHEILQ